jgi:hypothetical protein
MTMTAGGQYLARVRMNLAVITYRMVPMPNKPPNQHVQFIQQNVKMTKQIKLDKVKNKRSVTSMPIHTITEAQNRENFNLHTLSTLMATLICQNNNL